MNDDLINPDYIVMYTAYGGYPPFHLFLSFSRGSQQRIFAFSVARKKREPFQVGAVFSDTIELDFKLFYAPFRWRRRLRHAIRTGVESSRDSKDFLNRIWIVETLDEVMDILEAFPRTHKNYFSDDDLGVFKALVNNINRGGMAFFKHIRKATETYMEEGK